MKIMTVGIDLAKNVFAVHGIDEHGKAVLVRPSVRREQLLERVASLAPCVIGMEACSGAHHWARAFAALGHTPKLMAPKFVAPYRMAGRRGKNDAADAGAILAKRCSAPTCALYPSRASINKARCAYTGCARASLRNALPPSTASAAS